MIPVGVASQQPYGSAFDAAVLALSPQAYFDFQDSSFSTQINDLSGNGWHLVKGTDGPSPVASAVAALRSTVSQSARFVTGNAENNTTCYRMSVLTGGTCFPQQELIGSKFCFQWAWICNVEPNQDHYGWTFSNQEHVDQVAPHWVRFEAATPDILSCRARISAAIIDRNDTSPFSATPRIFTWKYDGSNLKLWRNGSLVASGAQTGSTGSYNGGLILNNKRAALANPNSFTYDIDHWSAWGVNDTLPSDTEITDMHAQYAAEVA